MSEMTWPRQLKDAHGPMRADKLAGAAIGMGDWGTESRALAAEGWVPPDMMTGLTLFVLGNQPKGNLRFVLLWGEQSTLLLALFFHLLVQTLLIL